jgi:Phage tail tube protein, GTA-gp10
MAQGDYEVDWANGRDTFNIARLKYLLALEEKCKCGFAEILLRLENGTWGIQMVRETIRLGLMGGGKSEVEANALVEIWVDLSDKLAHCAQLAHAIIRAKMVGVAGDNDIGAGKKKEEPAAEEPTIEESSERMAG